MLIAYILYADGDINSFYFLKVHSFSIVVVISILVFYFHSKVSSDD